MKLLGIGTGDCNINLGSEMIEEVESLNGYKNTDEEI